ncbi:pollen-specific leucine-rich repeat extensin-like protein 3 [Lycium ferocissimum]|uniref:pollen-specific leucine-rich repeat extensin-like protein 3 n=1 Tax=Lycium ferocissimum TaxID=112874 RepID=UPI002815C351|nr:pollen-specific leucine-rich repeat extensin-like protein 3 [Lycium ferocissimum]
MGNCISLKLCHLIISVMLAPHLGLVLCQLLPICHSCYFCEMASGDKNERHQINSSRGKSTTKSKGGKSTTKSRGKSTVFTSSPSHSTIPPLHPPSHGPSSKSKGESTVSTLSPSLSSIPPLHPPSQGPSSFSHSFYGTMPPQGYSSMPPPGYSSMPPPVYSSMPTQGYSGISTTAPFYNMPPPGCSSMPPSYVPPPGMHSAYLAAMERRPSPRLLRQRPLDQPVHAFLG